MLRSAELVLRSAVRPYRRRSASLRGGLGRLDERLVFVLGCPRSGTTFLAGAIGSLPGFVDLGEVLPLKAEIPRLARLDPQQAATRVRRILDLVRRLGLVAGLRAVEQTPETAFLVRAVALAFPCAKLVHVVRDGRDVVCSLLERGWLSAERSGTDDSGQPYGAHPRFWVEPGRDEEFAAASDPRRAAWAWRRYVSAARQAGADLYELRYERMYADPAATGEELARFLKAPASPLVGALRAAHAASIGRFRRHLTDEQLAEVEAEAGSLLRALGYPPAG